MCLVWTWEIFERFNWITFKLKITLFYYCARKSIFHISFMYEIRSNNLCARVRLMMMEGNESKKFTKNEKIFSSREFKWELFVHVFIKTYHVTYLKPVLCTITTNTKNNPKKLCIKNPVNKKCAARIISRYMRICEKGSLKMETEPT